MQAGKKEQLDLLFERNVIAEVIPDRATFEEHLLAGRPFHIYLGIDPTSDRLHLGHIQNVLVLEDLRKIGAKITLLFGSFTGLVGDPSGKSRTRAHLGARQVKDNMKTWRRQVAPILDLSWLGGVRIQYNSRWFDLFSLRDFLSVLQQTTVQQLLERDMFQKRLKGGEALYAHELVYPLLQGYDSVAMNVNAELCGTDQTFNALMGRTLLKRYRGKEKFVVTTNLIEADGVMMSKSAGTGVFVDISRRGHHAMYGSIMALSDGFVSPLLRGCTRVPMEKVRELEACTGTDLRDAKMFLAREIVRMFRGTTAADEAQEAYTEQFQRKGVPADVPKVFVHEGERLSDIIARALEISNASAKRKVSQGAVTLDGEKVNDIQFVVQGEGEKVLRAGRRIFRVVVRI